MNEPEPPRNDFDLPRFWRLLQDLEDRSIDPAQRAEVMTWLAESQRARRAYFEYFQQSAIFEMEGAKMDEAGRLPIVTADGPSRRLFRRSLGAAAVLVILLAIIATLVVTQRASPSLMQAQVAARTQWSVNEVPQENGNGPLAVEAGARIEVFSGTLELTLDSGTTLVLQGPARVSFPRVNEPVLQEGWLWIDSADGAEKLAISAGGFLIRNLGTRFGVRVPSDGSVEVHLMAGRVEVSEPETLREALTLEPGDAGVALRSGSDPEPVTLAHDPFPDLPGLLAARAGPRTTIMSQTPMGYWRLDETSAGALTNEISGGRPSGHGLEVQVGRPGVGSLGDFPGFPSDNPAIFLTGHPHKSTIIGLTGPRGVSRREGAVSFWIRSEEGRQSDQILWLAGRAWGENKMPETSYLHTRLTESGRVLFFIENEADDVELSSARRLSDGKWHHLAASWGPKAVTLFVDGHLVAQDLETRNFKDEFLKGRYVRFGKPGRDLSEQGFEAFRGWVDEVAMWNRPLTHEEVQAQFEAARDGRRE